LGFSWYRDANRYRYDGLYTVEKACLDRGLQGFLVRKYAESLIGCPAALPEHELEAEARDDFDESEVTEQMKGM